MIARAGLSARITTSATARHGTRVPDHYQFLTTSRVNSANYNHASVSSPRSLNYVTNVKSLPETARPRASVQPSDPSRLSRGRHKPFKRICILCDGTGQSLHRGEESMRTNVSRIGHAIRHNGPIQQLVFYQSGVGTSDLGEWSKTLASALGQGLEDHVLDAYTFLMHNYAEGDEIIIFGFSRGAFAARVLANFLARVGVFRKPMYTWELKQAWREYRLGPAAFKAYLKKLSQKCELDKTYWQNGHLPRTQKANIKVVGCWDTVSSIGVPENMLTKAVGWSRKYDYLDGTLANGIENAFHAIALDECRGPFSPNMWHLPKGPSFANINLEQRWFPGVHTNIGGGYPDQAIADLTLAWMIDRCRPYLDFNNAVLNVITRLHHQPWTIKSRQRQSNPEGYDLDYQGWGRGRIYDSYKGGQTWTWRYRTPGAYPVPEGHVTNERMHASVRERWMGMPDWRPKALDGFQPVEISDGIWEWQKRDRSGNVVMSIPEEPFECPKGSFEWNLRHASVKLHPKPEP